MEAHPNHNGLVVTDVNVKLYDRRSKMVAIASVVLNGSIVIPGIRVIKLDTGRTFVAMPSRRNSYGLHKDAVHPIDAETRAWFDQVVMREYSCSRLDEALLAAESESEDVVRREAV